MTRGCRESRRCTGTWRALPPIVLHSAGDDPLCIDADKIEKAAAEAGSGLVDHRRFDGLWHDFHLQAGVLAEADEAISDWARGCAPS